MKWIIHIDYKGNCWILDITDLDIIKEELDLNIMNQIYNEEWERKFLKGK